MSTEPQSAAPCSQEAAALGSLFFHVQRARADMIDAGLRPERAAAVNWEFASMDHFADIAQGKLRFTDEEPNP